MHHGTGHGRAKSTGANWVKKETGGSVHRHSPVIVPHPFSHYFLFYGKDRVFVESVISLFVEGDLIYGKCTVIG